MRKVSLLFLLLLALCGSKAAWAEVTFDANKYYYIIENTTGRCVSSSVPNKDGSYGLAVTAGDFGDKFKFTSSSEGKWKITTTSGTSFGAGGTVYWNTSTSEKEWTVEETSTSGVYTFYQSSATSGSEIKPGYLNFQNQTGTKANSLYVDYTSSADGDDTHRTKFRIVETSPCYNKPEFGGIVWTYNTTTNQFDADGQTSTATPGREDATTGYQHGKGPIYKFDNVGTVTVNSSTNTSDCGGIWVIGSTSNVTANLGSWAGSVLVETSAMATVSYGIDLKGTEADACATVWTDGTLTFSGRTSFSMNDGANQRWFIGENGAIRTAFTSVSKGTRSWDLQVVVADIPADGTRVRKSMELTKKVMTWGADLSSNINSITVWYKDESGNYTKLENAVTYDATGITVTYTGLGYDPVECAYTLTDVNGATYEGTFSVLWFGQNTAVPTLVGAEGYTLSNVNFANSGETYTMSATINFPFPVSSNGTETATGIQSELGTSKWFTNTDNNGIYPCASKDAANVITEGRINMYSWYIYPAFSNGTFSFKIKNAAGGYIPTIAETQSNGKKNYLVDDASSAGSYYFVPCVASGKGFSIKTDGTAFLTINTSGRKESVWVWGKTATTNHRGSNLTFPTITANYTTESAKAEVEQYQALTQFDILENSVVIGPSEFAAPATINTAITAAKGVTSTDADAVVAFLESQNAEYLKGYTSAVNTYGELANTQFTMKAQYGTLILACPATRPSGLNFYGCSASDGATLTLVEKTGNLKEKIPYIVEKAGETEGYTIIGWKKVADADATTYTEGWLTGVLSSETTYVPSGSYILSKYNNVLGFYQVEGNNVKVCPKNKCYLTVTSSEASQTRAFFFSGEGEVTGIEAIFGNTEKPVIYNMAGQRLNSLQKGVNIVNGHKVLVK